MRLGPTGAVAGDGRFNRKEYSGSKDNIDFVFFGFPRKYSRSFSACVRVHPANFSSLAALPPRIFCLSSSEIFSCFTVSTARTNVIGTGGVSLPKTT
jgi:hypothetical protein